MTRVDEPDRDDDHLLVDLRAALRQAGRPTPAMVAGGRAAFSWAGIDAELAVLTHDSLRDAPTGLRGAAAPFRTLEFTGARTSVDIELTGTGLTGRLIPPTSGEVGLCGPDGELRAVTTDELGCFDVEGVPGGPVRLRCRTASGVLLTDWFRR